MGRTRRAAALTIAVVALAGCGSDDDAEHRGARRRARPRRASSTRRRRSRSTARSRRSSRPGPAFDAKQAAAGKTLLSIPASSAIPFVQTIQNGMKEISGEVGMNFIDWPNQGKPVQWVQGMNQALDRKANVINLLAGINPGALGPQIAKAEQSGASVDRLAPLRRQPARHQRRRQRLDLLRAGRPAARGLGDRQDQRRRQRARRHHQRGGLDQADDDRHQGRVRQALRLGLQGQLGQHRDRRRRHADPAAGAVGAGQGPEDQLRDRAL